MKKIALNVIAALALSSTTLAAFDFSQSVIVYPDNAGAVEKNAAVDLERMLTQALSHPMKSVPESAFQGGSAIHVGNTAALQKALPDWKTVKDLTWRLKSADDQLYITGGTPSAVVLGVWDFLNRQGIYTIAPDCDVIPQLKTLEVSNLDVTKKLAFETFSLWPGLYGSQLKLRNVPERGALDKFMRHNYMDIVPLDNPAPFRVSTLPGGCHSLFKYVPPKQYEKTHPEYFAVNSQGNRVVTEISQLCFANPDVRKIAYEQLKKFIETDRANTPSDRTYDLYDFSQNDYRDFCFCPECRKIIKKYGSETGLLLDAVNEMANQLAKDYPGVYIQTFAYENTEKPLDSIRPAKNIVIKYCDLFGKSNCYQPLREQAERTPALLGWLKQSPNVYVWDYWNMAAEAAKAPGMIVDAEIDDIRYFHEKGVKALFIEGEIGCARPQSFVWLQPFLAGQMVRDMNCNVEELISLYLNAYYGPAAEAIRPYFDFLRAEVRKNPAAFNSGVLPTATLTKCFELLKPAEAATDTPASKLHVLFEKNVVLYALLERLRNEAIPNLDKAALIQQYEEGMRYAIEHNVLMSKTAKAHYTAELENELRSYSYNYALPPELADYPAEAITRLAHCGADYLYARIMPDAESDMPNALVWKPEDSTLCENPFPIGIYDHPTKRGISKRLTPVSNDEKYHWYYLGKFRLGRRTVIWSTKTWGMSAHLAPYYVNDEFATPEESPNNYNIWISIRFTGPNYVPGSKSPNRVYFDKIVLARPQAGDKAKLTADLPEALKNVPPKQLHLLTGDALIGNLKVDDFDSPAGSAALLDKTEKIGSKGLHGGIYSPTDKKYPVSNTVPFQKDEKYHWYHLGSCASPVGPNSRLFIADWTIWFNLADFHTASGKNLYDCWVSAKIQGAPFVPDSTKKPGLYVDRAILVEK